ncbi:substrate-binding domain-containing protein, partial [Staphylococcus aureus]|uniref:substrate-binding domain-containing protein n=1 Tax=Staphylococcus aureus TaxID=1280 RepID=UPI001642D26A
ILHTELSNPRGLTILDHIILQSPTPIFPINHQLPIPILPPLIQHPITIPKHISLIPYHHIHYPPYVSPPLTTLAQPITHIPKTSLTLLLQPLQ